MRHWNPVLVAAVMIGTCLASFASAQNVSRWYRDVDEAMTFARRHNKPMVLYISMDGCVYCHKMVDTTLRDRAVREMLGTRFVPAAIQAADRPDLIRRLGIQSFPTTLVVGPDGQILDKISGFVDQRQFQQRVGRFDTLHMTRRR